MVQFLWKLFSLTNCNIIKAFTVKFDLFKVFNLIKSISFLKNIEHKITDYPKLEGITLTFAICFSGMN